jgi:hypothetical protein
LPHYGALRLFRFSSSMSRNSLVISGGFLSMMLAGE